MSRQDVIAKALPKHMTADRMAMVAFSGIRKNPQPLSCSAQSLVASVITASQLGLEPGSLGHCHLVPYWNDTKTYDVQPQLGYRGMLALARRSGEISDLYGQLVYANDFFEVEYGLERKLVHRPAEDGEREEPRGAYGVARFKDGGCFFDYMPWQEVLRQAWKWLPMSLESMKMVEESEGAVKLEVAPDMTQMAYIAREESPAIEETPSTTPQETSGSEDQVSLDLEGEESSWKRLRDRCFRTL